MKYLCLVYLDAAHWNACSDQVCAEYAQQVAASRRLLAAEPLHGTHTATTVRVRNGEVLLFDGPFAETREMLAGFYLVDAKDLNEAIQLAAGIPPAQHGSVEVRPVRELQLAPG
ncbi:YciI family protein [Methylibium sp.]|uniref:YciI family protein n=1 Tax=Methylibium sp. TaxID=2067992 RepID=UPI00286B0811|nr:YciI family protein [Methylibium sp.]